MVFFILSLKEMFEASAEELFFDEYIQINDPDKLLGLSKKHNVTEFKIKFAKLLPAEMVKTKSLTFIGNEANMRYNVKENTLMNDNICLLRYFTYDFVVAMLTLMFPSDEVSFIADFKNSLKTPLLTQKPVKELLMKPINIPLGTYYSSVSIGNTPIIIDVVPYNGIDIQYSFQNYEEMIQSSLKHLQKFMSGSIRIPIKYNVSSLSVIFVPLTTDGSVPIVNINKMFNTIRLHSNTEINPPFDVSKMYVHSGIMDTYRSNPRPTAYVKLKDNVITPFKHINIDLNMFTMYCNQDIANDFAFMSVDVYEYGGFSFNYNTKGNIEDEQKVFKKCFKHATSYFKNIMVDYLTLHDYIISDNFNPEHYAVVISDIVTNINIPNCKFSVREDMKSTINNFNAFKVIYQMKTTLNFNTMIFNGIHLDHYLYKEIYNQSTISYDRLKMNHAINVHFGIINNNLIITTSKLNSIETFKMIMSILLANSKHFTTVDKDKLLKSYYSAETVESVIEFALKYPKQNLKSLQHEDPVLFGNRKISPTVIKTYSNLCQKPEQRPVLLSEQMYNELRQDKSNETRMVKLQNQTYPNKFIHLLCPDDKFNFMNFHTILNQKCIIRCTTRPSNQTQYTHCAQELGLKNIKLKSDATENQMIVKYNLFITAGRKCLVPEALGGYFSNYILANFSILSTENLVKKCLAKFNAKPFVIEHDEERSRLYLISTDFDENTDTVLLLKSSLRDNFYFYPVQIINQNIWYNLKDDKYLSELISHKISSVEHVKEFFDFITVTNYRYSTYTHSDLLGKGNTIFKDFIDIYHPSFVVDERTKEIVGLITEDNTFYTTPRYPVDDGNDEVMLTKINLTDALNRIQHGVYALPNLDEFINLPEPITSYYRDEVSNKFVMIKTHKYCIFINPVDVYDIKDNVDIVTIDYKSLLSRWRFSKYTEKMRQQNVQSLENNDPAMIIFNIITFYVFICFRSKLSIDITHVSEIIKKFDALAEEDSVVYIPGSNNRVISWSKSKISANSIEKYFEYYKTGNTSVFIKLIINLLRTDFEFWLASDEVIQQKVITAF
jgi:hypothetical protein